MKEQRPRGLESEVQPCMGAGSILPETKQGKRLFKIYQELFGTSSMKRSRSIHNHNHQCTPITALNKVYRSQLCDRRYHADSDGSGRSAQILRLCKSIWLGGR